MSVLLFLLRGVVSPRPRSDLRNVDGLVVQLDFAIRPFCARGLQPVGVVTVREVRFIMCAARFVSGMRAYGDHSRKNQHVSQLTREVQRLVGPFAAIT